MRFTLIILSLLGSLHAHALIGSEYSEGFANITNEEFRSRFHVRGEMFLTSADGKRLLAPTTELREWQPGRKTKTIEAYWHTQGKNIPVVAIYFVIEPKDDNSVVMNIHQYEDYDYNPITKKAKFGKLLREESITVENFAPVSWVAQTSRDQRVVMRLTPVLESVHEGTLDKLKIGGDRGTFTVADDQGYLWAAGVRFGGVLSGLTSHRGSLVFSYYPFPGAKIMGTAEGKKIVINAMDDLTVTVTNETDLIPGEDRVKVYARYLPKIKSGSVHSTLSFGLEKPEQLSPEFR